MRIANLTFIHISNATLLYLVDNRVLSTLQLRFMRQAFLFILIPLSFYAWASPAEAKPPPPAPKVFSNYVPGTTCKDGSAVRARLVEWLGFLWLTRSECKKRIPMPVTLAIPTGGNAIETDFLVYQERVFEESSAKGVVVLCRSETSKVDQKTRITVVVQKIPETDGFILNLSEAPSFYWSAVTATVDEENHYRGTSTINQEDFISLQINETGTKGTVKYAFEIGVGQVGTRQKAQGVAEHLYCHKP
jgi:hypothetical protein